MKLLNMKSNNTNIFKLDVLSINDHDMIPKFGLAALDHYFAQDTEKTLLFEYWIEEVVF